MNSIEPGCLAMVVRGPVAENIGRVFRVVRFIGQPGGQWTGDDYWEINKPMRTLFAQEDVYMQRTKNIQRIDSEQLPEEVEKESECEAV